MKTVRDVMRPASAWVTPDHTLESAVVLMRGFCVGGLPVVDAGRFVGMLDERAVLGSDPQTPVAEVMDVEPPTLTPDMTIRDAAAILTGSRAERAAVIAADHVVGVLSARDLLPEIGRSADPLTDLPWSDSLRDWAIDQLASGAEITVLFIDLDRFGLFNKLYGHIVGDEVLKSVGRVLVGATDPATDVACRYGGDEFAIGSLRGAAAAAQLAQEIRAQIAAIDVPGIKDRVSSSIGIRGGKRTREREHTHYAATLNNLINLASRDCTANKEAAADAPGSYAVVGARRTEPPRVRLARIEVMWQTSVARVRVDLELGQGESARYSASTSAETDEGGVLRLVAETTVAALRGVLPPGHDLRLTEVILNTLTDGQTLITSVGELIVEEGAASVAGSAVVGEDPYRAAAASVMAAVNRRLESILSGAPF